MQGKKLLILSAVLIAIIAVIWGVNSINNSSKAKLRGENAELFFPNINENSCKYIKIFTQRTDKKELITVFKHSGEWFVTKKDKKFSAATGSIASDKEAIDPKSDFPADSESVAKIFEKLLNLKKGEIFSNNPEKASLFQLDSAKGIFVEIGDQNGLEAGTFIIGKSGPVWDANYVKLLGDKNVYSAKGTIQYNFFTEFKRWRDKTIVKFNKSDAVKITMKPKNADPLVLEKTSDSTSDKWVITSPKKVSAKADEINKILNKLSNYKTYDWANADSLTDSAMGLDEPWYTVTVELKNGDKKIVEIGDKWEGSSKVWAKNPESDKRFVVWQSDVNAINVPLEKLEEVKKAEKDSTNTVQKKKK